MLPLARVVQGALVRQFADQLLSRINVRHHALIGLVYQHLLSRGQADLVTGLEHRHRLHALLGRSGWDLLLARKRRLEANADGYLLLFDESLTGSLILCR